MPTFHAVVWMDQAKSLIVMFDREHTEATRVRSHMHLKPRAGHHDDAAYFVEVARAVADCHEVLLAGPGLAHQHFHSWCGQHQPALAKAIVASVAMDHPSDGQLLAQARKFFKRFDNLAVDPALSVA